MIWTIVFLLAAIAAIYGVFSTCKNKVKAPLQAIPFKWKKILEDKVYFYRNLNDIQQLQFESDIQRFLKSVKISGVKTSVELEDRLLVASSAVIPLFGFPSWTYTHLDEVLLYPGAFDRNFNMDNPEEVITGMVGNGPMEGKVILSKPSLRTGFDISNDKKNVGIHEFVHLFDKETGSIDGIPPGFEDKAFTLPWIEFVRQKTDEILTETSDINPYGATNRQEFFAVASEYFFERPHLLQSKHPQLYEKLSAVFKLDTASIIDPFSFKRKTKPSRNAPCPCGSGKKFKKCCIA